jgi:hypothetical protein
MSAKRIQLRGSDSGNAFMRATARLSAARSGSRVVMPRTERRVTRPLCAEICAGAPSVASDEAPASINARL